MTDKKFKDEEIIKALECCGIDDCRFCPCYTEDLGCDHNLELLALDLIRRQNIKIEGLMRDILKLSTDIGDMTIRASKIKSEAVKEFAEKVDDMLWQIKVESLNKGEANKTCEIAHIRLQNLVKEMEGEGR